MRLILARNVIANESIRVRKARHGEETLDLSYQLRAGQITVEQLTALQRIAVQDLWMQEYLDAKR